MTPTPLMLLVWGVLLLSGLLPNRILAFRVPPTVAWTRSRRIIGVGAISVGAFWLTVDLALPLLFRSVNRAGTVADVIGWSSLVVATIVATFLITSIPRAPTVGR